MLQKVIVDIGKQKEGEGAYAHVDPIQLSGLGVPFKQALCFKVIDVLDANRDRGSQCDKHSHRQ